MEYNEKNIDRKSQRVLHALSQNDGKMNTSEIKEATGIQKNHILTHRYEVFEDAGLANKTLEQTELESGLQAQVSVVELTDEGWEFCKSHSLETKNSETIEEELESLKEDYRVMQTRIEDLEDRVEMYEDVLFGPADSDGALPNVVLARGMVVSLISHLEKQDISTKDLLNSSAESEMTELMKQTDYSIGYDN